MVGLMNLMFFMTNGSPQFVFQWFWCLFFAAVCGSLLFLFVVWLGFWGTFCGWWILWWFFMMQHLQNYLPFACSQQVKSCERWIVVTSIFEPSKATRKLGFLRELAFLNQHLLLVSLKGLCLYCSCSDLSAGLVGPFWSFGFRIFWRFAFHDFSYP